MKKYDIRIKKKHGSGLGNEIVEETKALNQDQHRTTFQFDAEDLGETNQRLSNRGSPSKGIRWCPREKGESTSGG